jgi:ferritin-like metal-binding protein YciE
MLPLFDGAGILHERHGGTKALSAAFRLAANHLIARSTEMPIKTMEELFLHGLEDLYFAEKQIVKALPKMAKAVKSRELKTAMEHHLKETREQVKRLEKAFKKLGEKAKGEECPAIEGLIEEGEKLMKETKDKDVVSAGLLAGAQAVEHYEIARYGTVVAWARLLGHEEIAELLEETLSEEKNADRVLNEIALREVNERAEKAA